jgi:hypothetical protein
LNVRSSISSVSSPPTTTTGRLIFSQRRSRDADVTTLNASAAESMG